MKTKIIVFVGACLLSIGVFVWRSQRLPAPVAKPGVLNLSHVLADTKVIALVDLAKPAAANLWKKIVDKIAASDGKTPTRISKNCAADVLMRVESLVLSSSHTLAEIRSDYAVVVRGRFEQKSLKRCVQEVSEGAPVEAEGHTFYRGASNKWLSIVSSDAVVFGTFDRVKGVVAAFDGRAPIATAENVPELLEWQRALRGQAMVVGALIPDGYAAKHHASYTVLATLLDVKSVLLTADVEAGEVVLRARLNAANANRANEVRTSLVQLVKLVFRRDADAEGVAKVRGTNVEARVALTKHQSEALAAKFEL
jgi:hypothetical protein